MKQIKKEKFNAYQLWQQAMQARKVFMQSKQHDENGVELTFKQKSKLWNAKYATHHGFKKVSQYDENGGLLLPS